ncbi:MAG: hypothetical protein GX892_11805 [Thermoanaerobacteraceae bacterium]|nr:hypothetical protein [Thermoanaerobacteraceae bacterium]
MKSHPENNESDKKESHTPKKLGALKSFFKSGENYVPHLSRKEKILARILESAKKNSKD